MARNTAKLSPIQLRTNSRADIQQSLDDMRNQIEAELSKIRKAIKAVS